MYNKGETCFIKLVLVVCVVIQRVNYVSSWFSLSKDICEMLLKKLLFIGEEIHTRTSFCLSYIPSGTVVLQIYGKHV